MLKLNLMLYRTTKISTKEYRLKAIYHSGIHSFPTHDVFPLVSLLTRIDELIP
jgi:hypothetical protein